MSPAAPGKMIMLIGAALTAFLLPASVPEADDRVRVLVMDSTLPGVPVKKEKLKKMDDMRGRLVLGDADYRGSLFVYRSDEGVYVVNDLPLETYVAGVVKAEVGSSWAMEALKAQAVIVRTYVLKQMSLSTRKEYHVTSSVLHQVYKGDTEDSDVAMAVASTDGEILTYEGEPIIAYYHSTTDGMTELAEEAFSKGFPYLKSVPASGKLSPLALWNRRIPLGEIALAIGVKEVHSIVTVSFTSTGRVGYLAYVSEGGAGFIKAKDLRAKLGWKRLPSTDFTVSVKGSDAYLSGRGFGHGVGLSQWSALEMAQAGKTYREILDHFYPGTELVRHEDL